MVKVIFTSIEDNTLHCLCAAEIGYDPDEGTLWVHGNDTLAKIYNLDKEQAERIIQAFFNSDRLDLRTHPAIIDTAFSATESDDEDDDDFNLLDDDDPACDADEPFVYEDGELNDAKITAALKQAAKDYENGEILEVREMLWKITNAIDEFDCCH